jgi:hypothetical protein
MADEEQGKKMGQIMAKAVTDAAFRQRLLGDATAVLREAGVTVPEGTSVKAVENTAELTYIVLPKRGLASPLSDAELDRVAGGTGCGDPNLMSGFTPGFPTISQCIGG